MKNTIYRDIIKEKVKFQKVNGLEKVREYAEGVQMPEKALRKIRINYGDLAINNPEVYINEMHGLFYEEIQKKHKLFQTYAMAMVIVNLGGNLDLLYHTYVANRKNIRLVSTLINEAPNKEKVWNALKDYDK